LAAGGVAAAGFSLAGAAAPTETKPATVRATKKKIAGIWIFMMSHLAVLLWQREKWHPTLRSQNLGFSPPSQLYLPAKATAGSS
jgi:hypothetical protein